MKLFQIEEPDGSQDASDGSGAAVGIDLCPETGGAVAIAIGGNAELLPGDDGERRLASPALDIARGVDADAVAAVLLELRRRAERQLARPVTHAVIAAVPLDGPSRAAIERAAATAGLAVLRLVERESAAHRASGADAAALGAAIEAEDLAPPLS